VATITVAGGGISGLTAALTLLESGHEVIVLEASTRFGGSIHTLHEDGYIIDAGPDSFLSGKPGGVQLVGKLGLTGQLVNTRADGGGTFILHEASLTPLPEGLTLLVPTQFRAVVETPLLSARGKARLLADYVIPARRDERDESVAAFVTRRVGREAFEHLAEPLLSGIYAGDARRLSLHATFPRLRDVERQHGGVIRGALAQRRSVRTATRQTSYTPFVSLHGGMGTLIDELVSALERADLRLAAGLAGIEQRDGGYLLTLSTHDTLEVDGLLLATPANVNSTLLLELDAALSAELAAIPYVSSATVSMAFREEDVVGRAAGRGFVVPRVEGRKITAVTWSSQKFAGRAPQGCALLRAFVGRAGAEDDAFLPEDELVELVLGELAAFMDITSDPHWARVFRWPNAMPQYHVGHLDRLDRIDRLLTQHPRLALTGAAYRGVGIPDCITNAMAVANALIGRLEGGRG
jgi:oxygen-dependent protoporphyrinogen oxidase